MTEDTTLVRAGPQSRNWLKTLRAEFSDFDYREAQHYASFRRTPHDRALAYLNPSKTSIWLFLPFEPDPEQGILKTPSSSNWAKQFPSVFRISRDSDVLMAVRLIERAAQVLPPSNSAKLDKPSSHQSTTTETSNSRYIEGIVYRVELDIHKRSRVARQACIRHFGSSCVVCGLNFGRRYGREFSGFIEVHHLIPLAGTPEKYEVDPVKDLRPVCPNCHASIHMRDPPYSIDEVRANYGLPSRRRVVRSREHLILGEAIFL